MSFRSPSDKMFPFAVLLLALSSALSAPSEKLPNLGIVGGERAKQELFNYQISLEYKGRHHCGGALVTTNVVITAAHCTQTIHQARFTVRVGSEGRGYGGEVYKVERYVNHPDFTMQNLRCDVAILKLTEHVKLDKNVGTLSLTSVEPATNSVALVSGWGHTAEKGPLSEDLVYAKVTIIDRNYCSQRLELFSKEMICAGKLEGGVDACKADSGGPLVANNKLVGIVSWGLGCGRPGLPGVYTNVALLRPWIDTTVQYLSA